MGNPASGTRLKVWRGPRGFHWKTAGRLERMTSFNKNPKAATAHSFFTWQRGGKLVD
jgi:hypothetical protein